MTALLLVECSPRHGGSQSRAAAALLVARLAARTPDVRIVRRDLAAAPPPFVDAGFTRAMHVPEADRSPGQAAALADSERLIGELEATDVLVLSTPMHNFTVPAVLKAWIDQVLRIGRSFHATPRGKEGRLRDRPTYVVVATGGLVSGAGARQPDFLTPYLTAVLATLGIRDVRFLHLEGLSGAPAAGARAAADTRAWLDAQLPLPADAAPTRT